MKSIVKSLESHLSDFDFTQLIFPNLCIGCSNVLYKYEHLVCLPCMHQLPLTRDWEPNMPRYTPFKGRVNVDRTISFVHFSKGDTIQFMLHQLKYKGRKDVGIGLGDLFGQYLLEFGVFNHVDGFVAVPLHPAKVVRRGYNQSEMLIKGLREHLDKPDLSKTLIRTEFTPSQTMHGRFERFRNMDGVFKVNGERRLAGKHLLLVDDVITTGSTLQACTAELLQAGAATVSIATIARA